MRECFCSDHSCHGRGGERAGVVVLVIHHQLQLVVILLGCIRVNRKGCEVCSRFRFLLVRLMRHQAMRCYEVLIVPKSWE